MGFGDFFSGVWDAVTGAVTNDTPTDLSNITPQQVSGLVQGVTQQFGNNWIPAQNAAVAEMGRALANFNSSKPHTGAQYQSFEIEINGIASTFAAYAASLNKSGATKGAGDVTRLANQVIADRETERNALGIAPASGPVTTTGTWQTGNPTVSGGGTVSSQMLIIAAIAAFLLLRRR